MDRVRRKYIIWGAGFRGKGLIDIVGSSSFIAAIDLFSESRYVNRELPIISYEEYKASYSDYIVIVTVSHSEDIIGMLRKDKIFTFFDLRESISELQGYGVRDLAKLYSSLEVFNRFGPAIISGIDFFGLLLYQHFEEEGRETYYYIKDDDFYIWGKCLLTKYNVKCLRQSDVEILKEFDIYCVTAEAIGAAKKQFTFGNIIDAYDFSYKIEEYYNPYVVKLQGQFDGKLCFIVANGDSLKAEDLNMLREHKIMCFGVNWVFLEDKSLWRPDFYVASDKRFVTSEEEIISEYSADIKFLVNTNEYRVKKKNNIFYLHFIANEHCPNGIKFSNNIARGAYRGGSVIYICIQLAVYLGFKKIYLIGADTPKNATVSRHFYDIEGASENSGTTHRNYDIAISSYRIAKEHAEKNGISIYNATRGGELDVFDRVDFDELIDSL